MNECVAFISMLFKNIPLFLYMRYSLIAELTSNLGSEGGIIHYLQKLSDINLLISLSHELYEKFKRANWFVFNVSIQTLSKWNSKTSMWMIIDRTMQFNQASKKNRLISQEHEQ